MGLQHTRGDTIFVRLMSKDFRVYFKDEVDIDNKKKIRELRDTLRDKGVNF